MFDQGLTALGLFDFFRAVQKLFQRAVFIDQQSGSFDADAGRAGDVINTVTSQCLHIDNTFREDAEFLEYTIAVDTALLHCVVHFNAVTHQLHHIFVRRNNCAAPTCFARLPRKGGNDVVGLKAFDFFAGDVEGLGRFAGQRHLRAQVFRHRVAVGLVEVIHIVAKRVAAFVEDHGDVGHITASVPFNITLEHVAKTSDCTDGQTIGFARQWGQGVIGAKDEGRAVNQMQMTSFVEIAAHKKMPPKRMCVGGILDVSSG